MSTYYWHNGVVRSPSGKVLDHCTWEQARAAAADCTFGPPATLIQGLPPER